MEDSKLKKFKELYKKNPKNPLASYSLANEYFKQKMYDEAINQIIEYLKIKDDEGAAYRMLAESYTELGKIAEAKEAYKKGIKAAMKHGHEGMAEEFEENIDFLD